MSRKTKTQKNREILDEIGKSASSWYSWYSDNIEQFKIDKRFLFCKQWSSEESAEFKRLRKPEMTINKIYDYYKKVVSSQREVTPNLQVRCLSGQCEQSDIDTREEIIRHIAYGSRSNIVYQTAFENMLAGGFGAFRVVVDHESPKSFNQHAFLKLIAHPERTFYDPDSKDPTKRDGNYCGFYDTMSRSEFKKRYPKLKNAASYNPPSEANVNFSWGDRDNITIVEYYKKHWFNFTLFLLDNGETVTEDEYKKIVEKYEEQLQMEDVSAIQEPIMLPGIQGTRKSRDYKIKYYKAVQDEIIEELEWPSKELPIVFCPGDSHYIDGKEKTISFTRYAMDAQRLLNYVVSELAQSVKNNRREQFMATPANVSGEAIIGMWKNSSIQQGVLLANPDPVTGQMPIKLPEPEIPQTLIALYNNLEKDIRTVLGFYESNLGTSGQQVSGAAIQERQKAGNQSFGVFFDNLERGIEQAGRVIMSLLPRIYDTERTVKGQSANGQVKDIMINQPSVAGGPAQNSMKNSEFDIVIECGPSFAVQREMAMETMLKLVQMGGPQVFTLLSDLLAKNTDLENTSQIVERLQTLVPPQILAKEEGRPPPPPQPNPQAQMAQAEMNLKMKELQLKAMQLQADQQKSESERKIEASKVMFDLEKLQQDRKMTGMRASAEVQKANMEREADIFQSMSKIVGAHAQVSKHKHELINAAIGS